MSGYRFQPGDRVIFARPHEHDAEDPGWTEVHVGAGAVGTVLERSKYAYQYRVEYRFGPVVVRQCPLDRQLDPAPTALLRKNPTLLQEVQGLMHVIQTCDEEEDADGLCSCARVLAEVLAEARGANPRPLTLGLTAAWDLSADAEGEEVYLLRDKDTGELFPVLDFDTLSEVEVHGDVHVATVVATGSVSAE